jgi:predicted  nucleic acid-binding Zn-ribbon protein
MQDTIHALLALQELDHEIFHLKDELRRLPEEQAARRAQIDAVIGRKNEAHKQAQELKVKIKELEDLSTISRQRIRKVENEAAMARGDMALQAAFQHQVKSLKRDISMAEEEALAHLSTVEALGGEEKKHAAEIEQAEKLYADFSRNVEAECAEARGKLAALEKERAIRMPSEIERESFVLYEKLVQSRGGVALAQLEDRICQACYIQVPVNVPVRVARGNALVQCPSCDRIFYLKD